MTLTTTRHRLRPFGKGQFEEDLFELIDDAITGDLAANRSLIEKALKVTLRAGGFRIISNALDLNLGVPVAMSGLDFDDFEQNLLVTLNFVLNEALEKGMGVVGDNPFLLTGGNRPLVAQLEGVFVPTPAHPRAVAWVRTRSLTLATSLTAESRLGVRRVLERAILNGTNPLVAAREIQAIAGLNNRQAFAVSNLRRSLIAAGSPNVEVRTVAYANRLRKFRAETIARTEMLAANNQAVRQSWGQMSDLGFINAETARIVWITANDELVCPICEPMESQDIGFFQQFTSDVRGGPISTPGRPPSQAREIITVDTPPVHPRCRCTIGLR